jgi:putative peptidoglycan lipid II flippase
VREQTFAVLFGAGRELDAFITAFASRTSCATCSPKALSAAFVTTFTQQLERAGDDAAWRLASRVVNALAIVVGLLTLAGIWLTPALVELIAPGFSQTPGKVELTVHLTRIMFPFLLLVALAAVAMGVLNTRNVFGVPASASAFFNLGSIVGGLGFAAWLAPGYLRGVLGGGAPADPTLAARAMTGMAIGTLTGGLLQLLVQLPSLRRIGFRYRPLLSFRDPGVRQVMRLMGPATIGAAAVQVNVFVNNNFASYLGDGPVSWLNVAFRFMQLPIGLFGVAIGTVTLPVVSRHRARGDAAGLQRTVRQALEMVALLCLPAAAGLGIVGVPIIGVIYEHGRFTAADTTAAAHAPPATPSASRDMPGSRCSRPRSRARRRAHADARERPLDPRELHAQLDVRARARLQAPRSRARDVRRRARQLRVALPAVPPAGRRDRRRGGRRAHRPRDGDHVRGRLGRRSLGRRDEPRGRDTALRASSRGDDPGCGRGLLGRLSCLRGRRPAAPPPRARGLRPAAAASASRSPAVRSRHAPG